MGALPFLYAACSVLSPAANERPCLRRLPSNSAAANGTRIATNRRRVSVSGTSRGGRGGGRRGDESGEKAFIDEDGMVKDMDGYLNYLSLEYDSVWDTKPSWCQPWTILLTGVTLSGCSWVLLHSLLATAVVSFFICAWWYIFLYAYPKEYTEMISERRKMWSQVLRTHLALKTPKIPIIEYKL